MQRNHTHIQNEIIAGALPKTGELPIIAMDGVDGLINIWVGRVAPSSITFLQTHPLIRVSYHQGYQVSLLPKLMECVSLF